MSSSSTSVTSMTSTESNKHEEKLAMDKNSSSLSNQLNSLREEFSDLEHISLTQSILGDNFKNDRGKFSEETVEQQTNPEPIFLKIENTITQSILGDIFKNDLGWSDEKIGYFQKLLNLTTVDAELRELLLKNPSEFLDKREALKALNTLLQKFFSRKSPDRVLKPLVELLISKKLQDTKARYEMEDFDLREIDEDYSNLKNKAYILILEITKALSGFGIFSGKNSSQEKEHTKNIELGLSSIAELIDTITGNPNQNFKPSVIQKQYKECTTNHQRSKLALSGSHEAYTLNSKRILRKVSDLNTGYDLNGTEYTHVETESPSGGFDSTFFWMKTEMLKVEQKTTEKEQKKVNEEDQKKINQVCDKCKLRTDGHFDLVTLRFTPITPSAQVAAERAAKKGRLDMLAVLFKDDRLKWTIYKGEGTLLDIAVKFNAGEEAIKYLKGQGIGYEAEQRVRKYFR